MTHAIPRLTFVSALPDDAAAACALGVLAAARAEGLRTTAIIIGANRDAPPAELLHELARVTDCAVQRIDPSLMAIPSMQRIVQRAAAESHLAAIIVFGSAEAVSASSSGLLDVLAALAAPPVICVDAESFARVRSSAMRGALDAAEFLERHGPAGLAAPTLLVAEAVGARRGPAIADATRLEVVSTIPRSARGGGVVLAKEALRALLDCALAAPVLPPPVVHRRRHVRARIGLVLDDCFDLYDEESLVQFEVAGAELAAISALDGTDFGELDGLIIGDGWIERHSAALSQARAFRAAVRGAVEAGVPTIASGGGYAYLSRGLRTLGGALHPFVGAVDAEAVAIAGELGRGHLEVELTADTVVGPVGTRLRGYVQRTWLMRGLPHGERSAYRTLSGPPDEGCGRHSLFCTHFRPYWPSHKGAAIRFVDRCVEYAVSRESELTGEDRETS